MAVTTTPTTLAAMAIPLEVEADLDASTLGQADPVAGYPEPQEDALGRRPALTLSASGAQTAGTTIEVATQQPGNIGSATFRWRHQIGGVSDTYWRGADQPNVLVGAAFPGWTAIVNQGEPHALTMPDGTQVLVYWQTNGTDRDVKATIYDPSTDSYSSAVTVVAGLDASHSVWPALCLIPDPGGSDSPILLCAYWLANDTTDLAQINVSASRDGGATWSVWATNVLPEALDLTVYVLHRIRWTYLNTALVMFTHQTGTEDALLVNRPENVRQYASSDLGASFSLIGTLQAESAVGDVWAVGYPDVVTIGTSAYLAYFVYREYPGSVFYQPTIIKVVQSAWVLAGMPLADASDWLFASNETFEWTGAAPLTFTFGAMSITASPDGMVVGTLVKPVTADGTYFGYTSIWNPATSTALNLSAAGRYWWYDNNSPSTEYPLDIAASWYRGQVRIHCTMESTGTDYDDRITRLDLGGCSTVTFSSAASMGTTIAAAWLYTVIPTTTADNYAWSSTSSGGATTSVTTNPGWETITTGGDVYWYDKVPVATTDQQIWQLWRAKVDSGGAVTVRTIACGMRAADVGYGYEVDLRFSTTQVRLYDVNGASTIATVTIATTTGIDVLMAVSTAGKVSCWVRVLNGDIDRSWTPVATNTQLTDDGGAGGTANHVMWGNRVPGTATSRWVPLGQNSGGALGTANLAGGFTNPTDLRGQPYSGSGGYVGANVEIGATGGPTITGDSYLIRPDAEHAIRYLAPVGADESPDNIRGGQQTGSRGTAAQWQATATSGYVLLRFPEQDNRFLTPILAIHIEGLNAESPAVVAYDYDAAGFTTLGTLGNVVTGLQYNRCNANDSTTLRVNTSAASSNTPYMRSGALKGCYWRFGTTGKVRPIIDNSEGRWGDAADAALPIIRLGGIDGTEPASGANGAIIYNRATFLCALTTTAEYGKFGLYWSSAPATYEGTPRANKVFPCWVEPLYISDDWGSTIRYDDPSEVYTVRSGQRFGRKIRISSRKVLTLPLTAIWSQRPIVTPSTQSPIVYKAYNNASYPLAGQYGDEFGKLLGAWQRSEGSKNPVVWIPNFDPSVATQTLIGDAAGLYGRITAPVAMTDEFGRYTSSGYAGVYRGDNWTIEEEI